MKFLLALALAFGFSASAHAGCKAGETHYWPSNNPALHNGEAGSQDVLWTCVNGKFVENGYTAPAPVYRGCVEGDVQYWPVSDSRNGGESGTVNEPWVCRNGKYVEMYPERHAQPAPTGPVYVCKNGSQMYFEEYGSTSGEVQQVLYTCVNGKFVRGNGRRHR